MERKFNKAANDYELTVSLLNEQKTQNAGMGSMRSKMEARLNELKEENVRLRVEN